MPRLRVWVESLSLASVERKWQKGIVIYSRHNWHSGKTFPLPSKGSKVRVQPPLLALGERQWKNEWLFTASIISTAVANSANNAKGKGSSPATVTGIGRKKMKKKCYSYFWVNFSSKLAEQTNNLLWLQQEGASPLKAFKTCNFSHHFLSLCANGSG